MYLKKKERERLCYLSAVLLAFITATENVVHANFRNTLKMHFNKNTAQGYFLLIWCDGSCISQPLFSGHLSQRDTIKKKPTMHDVLDMDYFGCPASSPRSKQHSNDFLGNHPNLLYWTTALGRGDTTTSSRGGQIT